MNWKLELRFKGERVGAMLLPSYDAAVMAIRDYGDLYSEIKWEDGTEQYSNREGHSLLIYPV